MEGVEKTEPTQLVQDVKVEVWELKWQCLVQECIHNQQVHVAIVMVPANKLVMQINVKIVMERKLLKKKR